MQSLAITTLSKSQVSEMARELDAHVEQFRTRSLTEAGPFTFVAADALVLKVRAAGPACHTGERSCFYRAVEGEGLVRVEEV